MRIEVTQEHIDKGKRGDACRCPIALAFKDATGVIPTVGRVLLIGKCTYSLPQDAQDFIRRFDIRKSSVEPFAFELDVKPHEIPNPSIDSSSSIRS